MPKEHFYFRSQFRCRLPEQNLKNHIFRNRIQIKECPTLQITYLN